MTTKIIYLDVIIIREIQRRNTTHQKVSKNIKFSSVLEVIGDRFFSCANEIGLSNSSLECYVRYIVHRRHSNPQNLNAVK